MFCIQCQSDLADCHCPDRVDRITSILNSKHLIFGDDYKKRIEANLEKAKQEKQITE